MLLEARFFSLKFTKYRLAAGLCPDPLGELKRSPRPPSRNKGGLLLRGGEERGGKRRGGEGGEEEGKGATCSKVLGGIDAPAPAYSLLKVGYWHAGALQIILHIMCSPCSVYVKYSSPSLWLSLFKNFVVWTEVAFFHCSCRYRVSVHCEGTRFRAGDIIVIRFDTCWHLLYFKGANFV